MCPPNPDMFDSTDDATYNYTQIPGINQNAQAKKVHAITVAIGKPGSPES